MMRTLPAMGLVIWDQLKDLYDHLELANNFAKINAHDHTPGRGTQLTTQSIEGEAITSSLLASESVTTAKIANEAVTGAKIGPGGVKYEEGPALSRPGFGKKGREYYANDTKHYSLDNGSAWIPLASSGYMSWGIVSSAGAIEAGSGDFTVAKTGTGLYEIKWTIEKPAVYSFVGNAHEEGKGLVGLVPYKLEKTKALVFTEIAPAESFSMRFSFIAISAS